jgi:hypothetical protein
MCWIAPTRAGPPPPPSWTNRSLLEGLNASNTVVNPYTRKTGSTECINGWRGLTPLVFNPWYGQARNQELYEPQSAIATIEWTHFADLINIVGRDKDGYARRYWDNVGVQYGLQAVAGGQITPDEFLKLNAMIGGWKKAADMVQEGLPFNPSGTELDLWSARNQVFSRDPLVPALRNEGSIKAMRAVYRAGQVFMGDIDIPVIDWRSYREAELNMHNSQQSFAARQRIRKVRGDADNQLIWFTDKALFDQTPEALDVMDQWMRNILANPGKGVAGNKPPLATDRCFDDKGVEIASGPNVWDGIIDSNQTGVCTSRFPTFSTSRRVAGGPFEQSLFKCQLIPVSEAKARGFYGTWMPAEDQINALMKIFPQGVCDYTKPDAGLPPEWK